ncbi:hypothetical protein R1sor_003952 [Riccia sorocarpa]|uniref:Dienelactone hydrolase domain-containing protein n=1 Tax=Riccia sorocarpa TaxID=122646 RepID=A0ABD3H6G3_9MARC
MATEACCIPAPPAEHIEEGKSKKFAGLDAYVNPGPANATTAVILVSDILGYDPPLLRKLADRTASKGYFVVVPDLFHGDPFVPPPDPKDRMAVLGVWKAKHDPTDLTDMKAIIKQLREQGIQKIGVTGCCWGGKVAVSLAIEETPVIDAAVLFHPSFLTHDDVRSIKAPVLFLIPEIDQQVPPEKAAEYDVNVPEEVKSAHKAHDDMLEWFKKHLTL